MFNCTGATNVNVSLSQIDEPEGEDQGRFSVNDSPFKVKSANQQMMGRCNSQNILLIA